MTWKECKECIKADLSRLAPNGYMGGGKYLVTNASFKITFWFRIGSYLKGKRGVLYKMVLLREERTFETLYLETIE